MASYVFVSTFGLANLKFVSFRIYKIALAGVGNRPQKCEKPRLHRGFSLGISLLPFWLGWLDSNQRIAAPKTTALPLGDTPL